MPLNISSVTDNYFTTARAGLDTALASTISAGATSVPCNSLSLYTTGENVVFVINPGDASLEAFFTGKVNGNTVEQVKWIDGPGAGVSHSSGAPIRDYVAAAHLALLTKGLNISHETDGTLKANTVNTSQLVSNAVTTAKILDANITTAKILDANITTAKLLDNNVTAAKLATNAITLGTTSITSNSTTTSTTAAAPSVPVSLTVTIPSGGREVEVEFYASRVANSNDGNASIVTLWDGAVGSGTQLQRAVITAATVNAGVPVTMKFKSTPSAGSKTYNIGLSATAATTATIEAASTYPAYLTVKVV